MFANAGKWPALMIVKGIWDYVEGPEGSLEAYRSAREKDVFAFRGPHLLATQNPENMRLGSIRMAKFARAAVLGAARADGAPAPADLKALVLSSPNHWELTSEPH